MKTLIAKAGYWWWLGWLWCGVILVLALMPAPEIPGAHFSDKLMHAAAFACLAAWFGALLKRRRWWLEALGLILFGITIECLQAIVGRDPQVLDVVADAVGVGLGLLLLRPLAVAGLIYIETRVRRPAKEY
ncbi:MAG: VanZ family protein [Salinisphaera sp.]|nr:VanZ family protein [Salinisphaera sp.]MDN5939580.1 VanZ family protein [Salinisphaera sp.]